MLKALRVISLAFIALVFSSVATAQDFDQRRLFFGGGLSQNKVSNLKTGTGFQFFGGYNFPELAPKFSVDAEAGYLTTGKMEVSSCPVSVFGFSCGETKFKGLWANGVARYRVAPNVELLGRAGLDFGDDDGFMIGIGAGYILNKNLKLRFEIVERDNVSSVQFNAVFYPW